MATVEVSNDGAVMTIRFNRPEKKNALTLEMYDRFADALGAAEADDATAVVVITGTGDAFCAGNDLNDFLAGTTLKGPSPQARLISALATFAKPLLAAVQGVAVGIGVTMLLHCDLVYASPTARFKTGFADLGVCPEAGSTVLLPARVGQLAANELLLRNLVVSAEEAQRLGLVGAVMDEVAAATHGIATELSLKPRDGLRTTKALLRQARGPLEDAIAAENREFGRLIQSPEFAAAAKALLR